MSSQDPSNPDILLTAGLDGTVFDKALQTLQTKITNLQASILAAQVKLAAAQAQYDANQNSAEEALFNKKKQRLNDEVAAKTQQLATLSNLQQQFVANQTYMAAQLAQSQATSAASSAASQIQSIQQVQNAQSGGGGIAGSLGLPSFGSTLISAGYGLRAAGQGIPGLRAIGALTTGIGFGGAAGLAGAGIGVGIAETIRGITELIGLYGDLADAAAKLDNGHELMGDQIDQLTGNLKDSLLPLLENVHDKEVEVLDALQANEPALDKLLSTFSLLVEGSIQFSEHILEAVTGTHNLTDAFAAIIQRTDAVLAAAPRVVSFLAAMVLSPSEAIPSLFSSGGDVKPKGGYQGPGLNQFGISVPADIDPNSAQSKNIGSLLKSIYQKQPKTSDKAQEIEAENTAELQKLANLEKELNIQTQINDIKQQQLDTEVDFIKTDQAKLDNLNSQLGTYVKITDLQIQSANLSVNSAQAKTEGALSGVATAYFSLPAGQTDSTDLEQKLLQYTKAQEAEAEAVQKRDNLIATSKQDLHAKIVAIMEAEIVVDKQTLQNMVDKTKIALEFDAAVEKQTDDLRDLNQEQESGAKLSSSVAQAAASQIAGGAVHTDSTNIGGYNVDVANMLGLSQTAINIIVRQAYQYTTDAWKSQISVQDSNTSLLQAELAKATDVGTREDLMQQIKESKKAADDLTQSLIASLEAQQALTVPGSAAWNNFQVQINNAKTAVANLGTQTNNTEKDLESAFSVILAHSNQLKGVFGGLTTDVAALGKSILDLSKVKMPDNSAAGSVSAGLGAIFASPGAFLTQGLPFLAAIASSAVTLVNQIKAIFTKSAVDMANSIKSQVDSIVAATQQSGAVAAGLMNLEIERTKAIQELSNTKGGQSQLNTLLPQIDSQIAQLQKTISSTIDTFNEQLAKLELGAPFSDMYDQINQAEQAINSFLQSVADPTTVQDKVNQFISLTLAGMQKTVQDAIDQETTAWTQGAEDAAGNLISINQQAQNSIDAENASFATAETQRQTDLATLKSNYAKQQITDAKNLIALQTQLTDEQTQEVTDLANIQNQGIAVRQQTSQESKAQQEADLQDQDKAQQQATQDQIDALHAQIAAEAAAYQTSLDQAATLEAQAQIDHQNTIDRINNEEARAQAAHDAAMAALETEAAYLSGPATDALNAYLAAWLAAFQAGALGTGSPTQTVDPTTASTVAAITQAMLEQMEQAVYNGTVAAMQQAAQNGYFNGVQTTSSPSPVWTPGDPLIVKALGAQMADAVTSAFNARLNQMARQTPI